MRPNQATTNTTSDRIATEMKDLIQENRDVHQAMQALEKHYAKTEMLKDQIQQNVTRKKELLNIAEQLQTSFGDTPTDTTKLRDIKIELAAIDEALPLLNKRLAPEGEIDRQEEDLTHNLEHVLRQALIPIQAAHQKIAEDKLDELVQLLQDFHNALTEAWPRQLSTGQHIKTNGHGRLSTGIKLPNVVDRLEFFTDDFHQHLKAAFHLGKNTDRSIQNPTPSQFPGM